MSVAAAGTRRDAPSSDQLFTITRGGGGVILICIFPLSYRLCLQRPIFVRSLFWHLYSVHVPDAPQLLDTHLGFVVACGVQIAGAETTAPICEWISSSVACMKLFLDLRRSLVVDCGRVYIYIYSGCLLSFTCFSRSRWAVTLLRTAGGAIPARRSKFSTLVGCRYPVMARQASFSTGSTLCACADLFHTGHEYSAVE